MDETNQHGQRPRTIRCQRPLDRPSSASAWRLGVIATAFLMWFLFDQFAKQRSRAHGEARARWKQPTRRKSLPSRV